MTQECEKGAIPWDMPTIDRLNYERISKMIPENRKPSEILFKKYADLLFAEMQTSGLLRETEHRLQREVDALRDFRDEAEAVLNGEVTDWADHFGKLWEYLEATKA